MVLDECLYQTGLGNRDIAKQILSQERRSMVYADSAEPKSIAEIRHAGVRIKGAVKGRDSINYGISILQEQEMLVTRRSHNIENELTNYTWLIDKEGRTTNKPIDLFNHTIDAIRYVAASKFTNKRKFIRAVAS